MAVETKKGHGARVRRGLQGGEKANEEQAHSKGRQQRCQQ